jgi:hypothetical protein
VTSIPDPLPPISTTVDQPHAPPSDEEVVYYTGTPLFGGKPEKVLVLALAGIFSLASPVLVKMTLGHWADGRISLALVFIGLCLWLWAFIIVKRTHYRITNYRIDFERGIISKDINTLELWHVEDISFHQTIFDRILGIGAINVISHDDKMPSLAMRGLPDARNLFETLKQRIISVKRQAGVMKLDTGN